MSKPSISILSREAILGAEDRTIVPVNVPEWGGTVHVRVLSGSERDAWELEHVANPGANFRARFLAYCACDPDGNPLFSPSDIEALSSKSGAALQRLFKKAAKLNLVSTADIDELEGNSEAGL
jgi:hypothetical protein